MKAKNLIVALVALTLTGAGSASAAVMKFGAMATGDQEVHDVTTDAFGKARLKVDDVAKSLTFSLSVMGINFNDLIDVGPGAGPVHLHSAPRGDNGPVVVPFTFAAGGYTDTADGFNLNRSMVSFADISVEGVNFKDFLRDLKAREIYVNVHTKEHPMGEIRGQLEVVPLPASALLLIGAIGGLAGLRRMRKG